MLASQIDYRNARNGAECQGDWVGEDIIMHAILKAVDEIVAFDASYADTFNVEEELEAHAYNAKVEAFEEAYEDHIAAMEPGSAFMESCYQAEEESEEERRKWANEHWDEVEAHSQRRPKEY